MRQFPVRRLGNNATSQDPHDDISSSSPSTECFIDNHYDGHFDTVDVCTTQLDLPPQLNAWNGFLDWSHDGSMLVSEPWPYQDGCYAGPTDFWTPGLTDCRTDSSVSVDSQTFEQIPPNGPILARTEYLNPPQVHSPQETAQHPVYHSSSNLPILENSRYASIPSYSADTQPRSLDSDWMGFSPRTVTSMTSHPVVETKPKFTTASTATNTNLALEWSPSNQITPETPISVFDVATPVSKRKHASPGPPPAKKSRQVVPQSELAEYVGVFENAPGALTTVKKRKKLDGAVRKAAQDVRKTGACHQCRFRKRTVSLPR